MIESKSLPVKEFSKDSETWSSSEEAIGPWKTTLQVLEASANALNQALAFGVTLATCWVAFYGENVGLLELHIGLATIGYQLLMVLSMVSLTTGTSWSSPLSQDGKRLFHWLIGSLASLMAVVGTALIIQAKGNNPHFQSKHGLWGYLGMLFTLLACLLGPLLLFWRRLPCPLPPPVIRLLHILPALAAFACGQVSLILGFQYKWFSSRTSPEVAEAFIWFTSLTIVLTAVNPLINVYRCIKTLTSQN